MAIRAVQSVVSRPIDGNLRWYVLIGAIGAIGPPPLGARYL